MDLSIRKTYHYQRVLPIQTMLNVLVLAIHLIAVTLTLIQKLRHAFNNAEVRSTISTDWMETKTAAPVSRYHKNIFPKRNPSSPLVRFNRKATEPKVVILRRTLKFKMRFPYRNLESGFVGVSWIIYLLLANYSLPIRYLPIQNTITYAKINYIVDFDKRYLKMFRYQSCGYEEQITPQHVSQPTITLRSCCEQRQGLFC